MLILSGVGKQTNEAIKHFFKTTTLVPYHTQCFLHQPYLISPVTKTIKAHVSLAAYPTALSKIFKIAPTTLPKITVNASTALPASSLRVSTYLFSHFFKPPSFMVEKQQGFLLLWIPLYNSTILKIFTKRGASTVLLYHTDITIIYCSWNKIPILSVKYVSLLNTFLMAWRSFPFFFFFFFIVFLTLAVFQY